MLLRQLELGTKPTPTPAAYLEQNIAAFHTDACCCLSFVHDFLLLVQMLVAALAVSSLWLLTFGAGLVQQLQLAVVEALVGLLLGLPVSIGFVGFVLVWC
ncbi:hypothetical protein U1Q18_017630 [Sarracenia purpurea var. burkii]